MKFKKLLFHYKLENIISEANTALDIGCGVGRVSFAMAKDFSKVLGIDVSEVMIEKAKEYRRSLSIENVEFFANNGMNLSQIPNNSVDFIFSYLTLQHCPSSTQVLKYIEEFSRTLKPKGVCLFQTRVSPTLKHHIKFIASKKLAKIRIFFKKDYHFEEAFTGNWTYSPKIYHVVSRCFSSFYLLQTPIELYEERFWNLKNEYERWKRSFFICIK